MAVCGEIWQDISIYGRVWHGMFRYILIYLDILHMAMYGEFNLVLYVQVCGNMVEYGEVFPGVVRYEKLWLSMTNYGQLLAKHVWRNMAEHDQYGSSCPSIAEYGRAWFSMAK